MPYYPNELDEKQWLPLLELGEFEPRWLVEYAYSVQEICGIQSAWAVGCTLHRHDLLDEVRPRLHAMRWLDAPGIAKWVDDVVAAALSPRAESVT